MTALPTVPPGVPKIEPETTPITTRKNVAADRWQGQLRGGRRPSAGFPRPRIEDAVHDVDEEVRDHDDDRGEDRDAEDDRVVAVRDGVDEVPPDPGDREDELDHERAGDD